MASFHHKGFNKERQKERDRNILEENRLREERFRKEKDRKVKKKKMIISGSIIVLLLLASLTTAYFFTPGSYDQFAQCLTEKGAVMYGEDWCPYTQGQKGMFGKSFRYIDYQVKKDLRKRPTWVIDGETYETVQSFERLSALTGCTF